MSTAKTITAEEANGSVHRFTLNKVPDHCPVCNRGQQVRDLDTSFFAKGIAIQRVYRCVFENCEQMFIATYAKNGSSGATLHSLSPLKSQPKIWPTDVAAVSPKFVDIYEQARTAELKDLDEISGPGYRKALEFLIKDWAIQMNESDETKIASMKLSKVISDYIEEQHIKDVAKRAAWLGNDETHYERRWELKDIEDLKRLIDITANWISMSALSAQAEKDMPDPRDAD